MPAKIVAMSCPQSEEAVGSSEIVSQARESAAANVDRPQRVLVVAGEESGDRHGGALVRELLALAPPGSLDIEALGGSELERAGARLRYRLVDHAAMLLWAVLKKLPTFIRIMGETRDRIAEWRPDVVVLIDYPGFNLRLARRAKALGVPVCYYVSPQVWAWRPGRVKKIARVIDRMLVLFPFEVDIYRGEGVDVHYVGHPLVDYLAAEHSDPNLEKRLGVGTREWLVGLLPGSRPAEIRALLPTMLEVAHRLRQRSPRPLRFVLPVAKPGLRGLVDPIVEAHQQQIQASGRAPLPLTVIDGSSSSVMQAARLGLVCSGTATLECLYNELPILVFYRVGWLSRILAQWLLSVKNIALANIVAGRTVVPEYLYSDPPLDAMVDQATELLRDGELRDECLQSLRKARKKVAEPGASRRAARSVLSMLGLQARGKSSIDVVPGSVGSMNTESTEDDHGD